jgi:nucleotide-binding universal stress UspA family protein
MISLRRILVATDFSETSTCAVNYAILLAETFQADLHVLHVVDNDTSLIVEGMVLLPTDFLDDLERAAEARLPQLIPEDKRAHLKVTLATRRGPAYWEIVEYSRRQQIDLIVMGTHGRGAFSHFFLGSVAERVVRCATCPVLTVRNPQHDSCELPH